MLWIADTRQGSPVARIRGPQVSGKESLGDESSLGDQSQPPSASAPSAEPRLCAERTCRFGGRAGFQPCLTNAARSALQCAAFLAACIRSVRGDSYLPSRELPRAGRKGSRQVFAFRRPRGTTPHWSEIPTSRLRHSVSARHTRRVESPLTCAESVTSIFLLVNFLRGRFRLSNPPAAPTHRIHFHLKSIF